jgi:hypothetical protein
VGLLGGWLQWCRAWYHSVQPAGPTLADHLARRPAAEQGRVFVADGQKYLALLGPIQVLPRLPSGWPVYVFDSAGRLVDWTPDDGDDEEFTRRWAGAFAGRAVTPDEVAAWPGSGQ